MYVIEWLLNRLKKEYAIHWSDMRLRDRVACGGCT